MGILNITPDSFYASSRSVYDQDILKKSEKMLIEGATILDIGGYSSRPGADDISEDEELSRVITAIKLITKEFPHAVLSIDTFRSEVAKQAVLEGVLIINDISAGELDSNMFQTAAALKVPYIAMHMRGNPQNMKSLTDYENIVKEIVDYFHVKINKLHELGVKDVVIDPGFGFAKTIDQNFTLLKHLEYFKVLGMPLLVGVSRKSMIWKTLEITPEEGLNGTTALHMTALLKGANILRTHDVKEAVEAIQLYSKICSA